MRFVKTAIQIRSVISANYLLWARQNSQMSQLICCSKNSTASQSKQHDIHFILILNEACDLSYLFSICVLNEAHDFSYSFSIYVLNEAHNLSAVRTQLCSLISFIVWYHLQFDIVSRFDMICSLIWFAVWYYMQFDIVYTHSFYFSYSISIVYLLVFIFLN